MESFDMDRSGYDLSALRETSTGNRTTTLRDFDPEPPARESSEPKPAPETPSRKKPAPETDSRTPDATDSHKNIVSTVKFLSDWRLSRFFGIAFILIAGYMLLASISYIATGAADQSIVQNQTASEIAANHSGVENATGWVGALVSYFLMYRWLGLGGFIIIFYIAALGISLVKFRHFKFWQLTFKSLVSAIAVSDIMGFATYFTPTPEFWGGEHGYWLNHLLIENASVWGALAVALLMLSALTLIFYNPIRAAVTSVRTAVARRKAAISQRYRSSMAAARQAMEEEKRRQQQESAPKKPQQPEPVAEQQTRRNSVTELESIDDTAARDVADEPVTGTVTVVPRTVSVHETAGHTPAAGSAALTLEDIPETATAAAETAGDENRTPAGTQEVPENKPDTPTPMHVEQSVVEEAEEIDIDAYDPTAELSRYRFPSIDLLKLRRNTIGTIDEEEQEENKATITRTLRSYGIEIESIKATVGPTITLYEIVPAQGVRIAKIKRLGDDMTLSLSAIGIRIIAPMPGKGTIGMEVPNKNPQTVGIRTILTSKAYHESTAELPIAMGTTISNDVYVTDLAKMPHLLVAGATGMGKSVGLNTIIASLLFKKHPAELKFVLVDPKMVEFSLYKCLERHYLAKLPEEDDAIITDPSKVVATLNSLCIEMDNRYALLSEAGMRGIKEYNQKFISRRLNPEKGHRYLPYIVVVIDEFADLILTAGKEVETPISRIAAKARAVGIHMILATQRPSVNVITGVIKANFPGRMAFRVTQMNDSRTIIDRPGAEQLIGKGDMLISRDGVIDRVQCAFIDTDEVEAICKSISDQMGYPTAYELPDQLPASAENAGGGASAGDRDPLFVEAGEAVIAANSGSASLLQRKFNIGYPRAGKLIDQLEAFGVLGANTGSGKPRPVLMDIVTFTRLTE